ncbi:MAG: Glyoxalase/bleomycin resistance protein/dioxygenase [Paenibacillaceae bacterium]|jgi:lactoylglutathione lyase|nr:Glyoxalase/bleomycin resistance protein/dioxygenase [Paenibacillaceae bacterium]
MKFCWTTIAVNNMEESLEFYQGIVGLSVSSKIALGPGAEIAFLGEGETKVELICDPNLEVPGRLEGISMGFEVDSLDEKLQFVQSKGLAIDGGPFQPNPHVKFFYVRDPNGVRIQFVENL